MQERRWESFLRLHWIVLSLSIVLAPIGAGAQVPSFVLDRTLLNPTNSSNFFGISVAAGAGETVWVGAPLANAGTGVVYRFDSSGHVDEFPNPNAAGAGSRFGSSVAALGNDVLVGAPLDGTNGQN